MDHLEDERLSRLVDGDLAPEERRLAGTHLTSCAVCEERLDALRSTVALLQGLPSPRPARSFQLAPSHARPASSWRRFTALLPAGMPALRAAVVAVVLVLGGAAAFTAIQDDADLGGPSTGDVESDPTVAPADGVGAPALVATLPDAMVEQSQVETPRPTATTNAAVSRSGQDVNAAEIATATAPPTRSVAIEVPPVSAAPDTAPTSTPRPLPTPTPERDAIFVIDEEESSDVAGDAVPASTATTASEADEPVDEVSSDEAVSHSDGEAPAVEAPQDAQADEAPPESSSAFAPPTATTSASPSPTRRPTLRVSTPRASPVASPVASPLASPAASPSGQAIPFEGGTADGMSSRRIDEMLALAILLFAGGIVVAVRAPRGVPR